MNEMLLWLPSLAKTYQEYLMDLTLRQQVARQDIVAKCFYLIKFAQITVWPRVATHAYRR